MKYLENYTVYTFDEPVTLHEGDTMTTLWQNHDFANGGVKLKNGDMLTLQMTRILEELDVYSNYSNKRVRIVWNPQVNMWFVYMLDDEDQPNRANFCVERLEIHTVGVCDGIKPKYAPEGSPSFIGTIAQHATLPNRTSKTLVVHPFAPTKLFVDCGAGIGNISTLTEVGGIEFTYGKRVLVDGSKMFCKLS